MEEVSEKNKPLKSEFDFLLNSRFKTKKKKFDMN